MRNLKTITILALCSLLFCLASCDKQEEIPQTVRVGVLFPMSGELASVGEDNQNGATLAAEEINAAGGIRSLKGARLELVFGDTQGKNDVGVQEAKRLIHEEKVSAIIGVYNSSVATVVTEIAEQLSTPIILSTGIADIITERGFQYTFRVIPKAEFYGRDQVRFLKDLDDLTGYPVRRVAILHENTAFGTSTALAQKRALQQYGLELVATVSYRSEGATDLSAEVKQAALAKPDAILATTYANDSILIARALKEAHLHVPFVDTAGGVISSMFQEELGDQAEGFFSVTEYSKFFPAGKQLHHNFKKRFGKDYTGDSVLSYQCTLTLKDALERAASVDRNKIRDALASTDIPFGTIMILPSERLAFDESGQNKYATLFVVQIQKGELVPVWPKDYATNQVIWNPPPQQKDAEELSEE